MIHSALPRGALVLVTLAFGLLPQHQVSAAEHNPGMWTIFSTTDSITRDGLPTRWHYGFDAQARYFDIGSGANQWLVRPAIGYEFNNGAKAWVGYARFRSRNSSGRVTDENRYWQQLDWRVGELGGGKLAMRARLEQRSVDTGDDLGVVLRFMAKYVRPISEDGDKSLILGLEPFFDLVDTDWDGESGPGQNRVFVGVGWRLSERLTLECGYMNQRFWRDRAGDTVNHLAVFTIKTTF